MAVYDGVKGSGLEVEHLDVGPSLADGECQNIDILLREIGRDIIIGPGNMKQRNWRVGRMMTYEERVAVFNVQCFVLDLVRLDGEQQSVPVHCESLHNVTFIIVLIIMTTLISDTW